MENSLKYWLWLTTRPGLKPNQMLRLVYEFDESPESIFCATPEHLKDLGLTPQQIASLEDKNFDRVEKILADCDRLDLHHITWQDASYPSNLRNLSDPPMVLYAKGKMPCQVDGPTIAMVGARDCTPYGIHMASRFALELTYSKALVVTGMAQGIDSACVEGALKAGGPLISIIAGGHDKIYPKSSANYYADVPVSGVLLSEYPPGTDHKAEHFRPRNRILSGIADAVFVLEAKATGGTMLTANHAIEQERDIFVMPGDVNCPLTFGPMKLMQEDHAYPIGKTEDFLKFYKDTYPSYQGKFMNPTVESERLSEIENRVESYVPQGRKTKKKSKDSKEIKESKDREETEQTKETKPEPIKPQKIPTPESQFTEVELSILRVLQEEDQDVDYLSAITELTTKELLSTLTSLMVDGAVEEIAERRFASLVALEA